ncbi:hypothetical protein, partial [uncultured Duncaniella sp.]
EGQSSYPEARRGVNGQFSTMGIEDVRQYYPPPTIGKIVTLLRRQNQKQQRVSHHDQPSVALYLTHSLPRVE